MQEFKQFVELIEKLHSEQGCPWDKQQTIESMKQYILEEAQEIATAIDNKDIEELKEELGDLLLNILHICQIAKQRQLFDVEQVLCTIQQKMIRRHPHVFGNRKFADIAAISKHWEEVKQQEKLEKMKKSELKHKVRNNGENNG